MNPEKLVALLEQLPNAVWEDFVNGRDLLLINDQAIELSNNENHPAVLVKAADFQSDFPSRVKQNVITKAVYLLADFYRTHPISRVEFNRQVNLLAKQLGAGGFAALFGELPKYSLFVEGGEVIAESVESPRHRYGTYFELAESLPEHEIELAFSEWLRSGEAHQQYLSMNVCRYNC